MAEKCEDQKFMCRDESWLVQCNRIEKIRLLCPKTCGLCDDGGAGTVNIIISGAKAIGNSAIPTLIPLDSRNSALQTSQSTPNSETVVQISSTSGFTFPVPGVVWYLVLLGTFLLVIAVGLIVIFERHHLSKLLGKKSYCCTNSYGQSGDIRTDGSLFFITQCYIREAWKPVVAQIASPMTMLENNRMHYRSLWLEAAPKPVKPIVKDLRWKDQEELNRSYLPADHLTTVVSQHHINMNEKTSEVSGSGSLSVNDG
ncbi:unnamed protein product [Oikopleura dioica]|uniref:ShKT domain-containing protein n=1 Tax=Oikopleura dioica TaxID=34765 RepID=E4WS09_OIKDI|nr:unnamed protein product [Oikopleura dioica]